MMAMWIILTLFTLSSCVSAKSQLDALLVGYESSTRPDSEGDPVVVTAYIHMSSIRDINIKNQEFTADLYLRMFWKDNRLTFDPRQTSSIQVSSNKYDRIWKPDVYFDNARVIVSNEQPSVSIRIESDGEVYYSQRVTATFGCPLYHGMRNFPLDTEKCKIIFSTYGMTVNDVELEWGPGPVTISDDAEPDEYKLIKPKTSDKAERFETGSFKYMIVEFTLERIVSYQTKTTFIPTACFVIIAYLSFWLEPKAIAPRSIMCLISFIGNLIITERVSDKLPAFGFTMAIDIWLRICFTFIFIAMIESVLVESLQRFRAYRSGSGTEDSPKMHRTLYIAVWIDRMFRLLYPAGFLVFNAIFWPYYNSQ